MIVDCHAHLLPPRRTYKLIEWTLRFNPHHPIPLDVTLDALLDEYARAGVDLVWNFAHAIFPDETEPLNAWNRRLGQDHPRIVPFGTCHPLAPDPVAVVDRCFGEHGFHGMKFHPFVQRFTPWEERWFPVWERIERHRGIVVFHTGFEDFYGGPLAIERFEPVLRAFPELVIVFAHANYPRVAAAFELVAKYPNLHVDTVHVFSKLSDSWDPAQQASVWSQLRAGIEAFPDRVMFGTDHPSGTGTLARMYEDFRAFGLAPEIEAKLAGETARRLLRAAGWRPAPADA
jgi:predicted TIM-barrel fold metal-dependent hydrolase